MCDRNSASSSHGVESPLRKTNDCIHLGEDRKDIFVCVVCGLNVAEEKPTEEGGRLNYLLFSFPFFWFVDSI